MMEEGVSIPLPTLDVLNSVSIPNHCPVPWEEMEGDSRTRHCIQCSQRVHDLSELTANEAVELLSNSGGHPCVRLYQRPDGRVMTSDCMTKRERVWKWMSRRSAWAAALFALVFLSGCETMTQGMMASPYREAVKIEPPAPSTQQTPPAQ
jgi:hypothetical protein